VSDIDPGDLALAGRRSHSEKFAQDSSDPTGNGGSHLRPEREGLPPGYRMRADAHYVEQLASRRQEKQEKIERGDSRASDAAEGEGAAEARDRRSERILAQLGEEIAAISAAAGLLTGDGATLSRRLSADLIRAQAGRAAWLLRAHALIDGGPRGHARPRPIGALLEAVRQSIAAECRLSGVGVQIHASDWGTTVAVDEATFIAGVTGAVIATLGLLGPSEGAMIRISADASGGELRALEVSQDEVTASSALGLRFFDASWTDRPGGFAAAIGALTARAAALQHGGNATFLMGERRGTTIRLGLARTH
jgi:hypothetical protein